MAIANCRESTAYWACGNTSVARCRSRGVGRAAAEVHGAPTGRQGAGDAGRRTATIFEGFAGTEIETSGAWAE
jgi:hypothetical protein